MNTGRPRQTHRPTVGDDDPRDHVVYAISDALNSVPFPVALAAIERVLVMVLCQFSADDAPDVLGRMTARAQSLADEIRSEIGT